MGHEVDWKFWEAPLQRIVVDDVFTTKIGMLTLAYSNFQTNPHGSFSQVNDFEPQPLPQPLTDEPLPKGTGS